MTIIMAFSEAECWTHSRLIVAPGQHIQRPGSALPWLSKALVQTSLFLIQSMPSQTTSVIVVVRGTMIHREPLATKKCNLHKQTQSCSHILFATCDGLPDDELYGTIPWWWCLTMIIRLSLKRALDRTPINLWTRWWIHRTCTHIHLHPMMK